MRSTIRRAAHILVLLLFLRPSFARAISQAEPPDFANTAATAVSYQLSPGANTFSGTIPAGTPDEDYFKLTVPAGSQITQMVSSGSGITLPGPLPLHAGTFVVKVAPALMPTAQPWSVTLTVAPGADFAVTIAGGEVSIMATGALDDVLSAGESEVGNEVYVSAPGRRFSVNGTLAAVGDGVIFSLVGVSKVLIDTGAGRDAINAGSFPRTQFPSLTINGGPGDDIVTLEGTVAFGYLHHLNVDLQNDDANPGIDTVQIAAGAHFSGEVNAEFVIRCSRNISVAAGASFGASTVVMEANQQTSATSGDFIGVNLDGGSVFASDLHIAGRGGSAAGGGQNGVVISAGGSAVMEQGVVFGKGGSGGGAGNCGVNITGLNSVIDGGLTVVRGEGGGVPSGTANVGVSVRTGGKILGALVKVDGAGGTGTNSNHGVEIT